MQLTPESGGNSKLIHVQSGVQIEHVVTHHPSALGVKACGEAGPDGKVIRGEDGGHLTQRAAVLLDPVEGLESVTSHLCHVPPAWGQIIPAQTETTLCD